MRHRAWTQVAADRAVGIVVDLHVLPPGDQDRNRRRQAQAERGVQALRPGVDRAQCVFDQCIERIGAPISPRPASQLSSSLVGKKAMNRDMDRPCRDDRFAMISTIFRWTQRI
jgi:hypothetical protein